MATEAKTAVTELNGCKYSDFHLNYHYDNYTADYSNEEN